MTTAPYRVSKQPFEDLYLTESPLTPFTSISDFTDEKEVLAWLKNSVDYCNRYYTNYFNVQYDNMLLYRGVQWMVDSTPNKFFDRINFAPRNPPRIVINHLYDATEHWVSKLTRYRPAVAIYPSNADQIDADNAKISKHVLDYIWYINQIDKKNADMVRLTKICGESFRFVTFDPDLGDIHPDYIQASKDGARVPLLDSEGQPIVNTKGDPLFIQTAVRIGEVDHQVWPGYHVFEEPCNRREEINWAIRWRYVHVDVLKSEYPDQSSMIKATSGYEQWGNGRWEYNHKKDQVMVYELWHRHHKLLSKGRYIKFTKDVILENSDLPYSHGKLPYIYLPDIELPDQIRGMSFFQQLFPIQHQINAVASLVYKAMVLFAHPKWVMSDGSCDVHQLLNESTVVSYTNDPPQLISSSGIPTEMFNWHSILVEMFAKISGQYLLSTGEAPSGVRAAKALRVIEEQEDKRAYYMSIKYNDICLVQDARLALATAGDFYDNSDGRLIRILGRDSEYKIRRFETANLSKPYDIRIETTTGLSQSPAARIEEINEIANIRITPDAPFTREQYIDMLGLTNLEQFRDVVTKAFQCAQSENEDMIAGITIAEPTPSEDLIIHWKTHIQAMQGRDFKEKLFPDRRSLMERHLYITEYLMWKKAFGIQLSTGQYIVMPSLPFQQKLMIECPNWPTVFEIPAPGTLPSIPGMPPGMGAGPMGPAPSPVDSMLPPQPTDPGMPLDTGAVPSLPEMSLTPTPLPI